MLFEPRGGGLRNGWAGRVGRPGLCRTEVGRAEQSRVIRVQPIEVAVEQGARGRGWSATALFSDGTGPPGFEHGSGAPEPPRDPNTARESDRAGTEVLAGGATDGTLPLASGEAHARRPPAYRSR